MNKYRYILEKGSAKHLCPNCEHKTYVRYVDINTGNYLPEKYGRCDREVNCSYHLNPYNDGYGKVIKEENHECHSKTWQSIKSTNQSIQNIKPEPAFIPEEILKQTLKSYEQNVFIQNLLNQVPFPFEPEDVGKIISLYYLGTVCTGYMTGGVTFPYIDAKGNIRAMQVKLFDKDNHTTRTDFFHSIIEKKYKEYGQELPRWLSEYKMNDTKVSCLFGEHLLQKYPFNPVALVEAPKTAILSTLYFGPPIYSKDLIWIAVYNLSSLNFERCRSLNGRNVFLFPDLSENGNAFNIWSKKASEFETRLPGTKFVVSNFLEYHASDLERINGYDLADFLIHLDWRDFRSPSFKLDEHSKITPLLTVTINGEKGDSQKKKRSHIKNSQHIKETNTWPIAEYEQFFKSAIIPKSPISLNGHTKIFDPNKFIYSHLKIVKAQNGKPVYRPYYDRLEKLKLQLTLNKN